MVKKKKPQLKSNVQRGFATTSVPKRETPTTNERTNDAVASGTTKQREAAESSHPHSHPDGQMTAVATKTTDSHKSKGPTGGEDAFDPEAEELQALQNVVQQVYPKVEKETQRRGKTIQFQQRFSKTLLPVSMDPDVCAETLALTRDGREPITKCEEATFLAEERGADGHKDSGDSDGRMILQNMLGMSMPEESEAKALERALTTWELLLSLGFSREQATLALTYAPNLDIEECVAWLVAQLDVRTYRALSLNVDAPQEYVAPKAASMDDSIPPMYDGYAFTRAEQSEIGSFADDAEKKKKKNDASKLVSAASLDAETQDAIRRGTETVVTSLNALLDTDDALLDVIEHPIEAWCTARIVAMQVDKDRSRRRKMLGGTPDDELAQLVAEAEAQRQLDRLAARTKDVMQQSEIQPQFHRTLATQRFRERMRQREAEEAEKMAAIQREEEAKRQRRSDIEQLDEQTSADRGDEVANANRYEPSGTDTDADAHGDAKDNAPDPADDDEAGALGDFAGLFEQPDEPGSSGATGDVSVRLRDIPAQSTQRSPRSLLTDVLKAVDPYAQHKFTLVSGKSAVRSQLQIQWNASGGRPPLVDTIKLTKEGCATRALADDYVATIALNCFGRERQVQRHLSKGFRDIWDELEQMRMEQKHAFLRDEVLHVQHLLEHRNRAMRVPETVQALKRDSRRAQPESEPASTPSVRRSRTREAQPQLAEMWAHRASSKAYELMLRGRQDLPIYQARDTILQSVATSQVVVLSGETGCGKSTQLPAYLMEDCLARGEPCKIYVTEPRRISAISLAERVSQEMGEAPRSVGSAESLVGYAIRLESQIGANARLIYATTGIVLRMLESSVLDDVTHIIVDEVHERSIESDFLLIVLKTLMHERPDLKIVLMSATLDAERISAYFGGCPTLAVPGRTFPVDVHYLEDVLELCDDYTLDLNSPYARQTEKLNKVEVQEDVDGDLVDGEEDDGDSHDNEDKAASERKKLDDAGAVSQVNDTTNGPTPRYSAKTIDTLLHLNEHKINYELLTALLERICTEPKYASFSRAILVFLPGMGEIRECLRYLTELRRFQTECQVHVLHSSVATEEQSAAFLPPPEGQRKIVLATNIAETGITIPDITCVVDSGRHREMRYDEKRKISRLVDCFIARSNAKQRRGRAGRVQHGICFHLFTRKRHDDYMDPHPVPEMLRLSLQELALQLKVMPLRIGTSIENALAQALDPPLAVNVQRAVASLVEVEALTPNEDITPLGRHLCHMPLDVHLAKFLLVSVLLGCVDAALSIAAVLNAKSPFLKSMGRETGRGRSAFQTHDSDFMAFAQMFHAWRAAVGRHQGQSFCTAHSLSADVLYQIEELRQQYFAYLVDTGFVRVEASVRNDLARRRARHGRPKLMSIPEHLDVYGQSAPVVTLALVTAMYPKLLQVDENTQQMRTLLNNQPALVHPSSVNARRALGTTSTHFVLYHAIVYSFRLYAWETAVVDDRMVLLVGGDAEFKHTSRSMYIDHNRVRMTTYDAPSLVALRVLRTQLRELFQASFRSPGQPWTRTQHRVMELVLKSLGVPVKPPLST